VADENSFKSRSSTAVDNTLDKLGVPAHRLGPCCVTPNHVHLNTPLIFHAKRRAVFRPGAAVIIEPSCGNVGVAEPFLHFGDISVIVERVSRGHGAQRVDADPKAESCRVGPDQFVDGMGRERFIKAASAIVFERPEESAVLVVAVSRGIEIGRKHGNTLVSTLRPGYLATRRYRCGL
jgi:hypothetical protein